MVIRLEKCKSAEAAIRLKRAGEIQRAIDGGFDIFCFRC